MEVDISKKVNYILKYSLPGLVLLALLCAAGIWFYQQQNNVLTIHDAQITGNLVSTKVKAAGTIEEISVEDGAYVEAGQVIARLQVNVTEEQLKQLQQTVDLAQKNLNTIKAGTTITQPIVSGGGDSSAAQAELARASTNMERMDQLYSLGAISAAKRDAAAADYAAAQAAVHAASQSSVSYQSTLQPSSPEVIRNAELQVKQAKAALEAAKQDSTATEIQAPVAGTIYYTDVTVGTKVKAGQTILNIGDASNIWLEAYIRPEQKTKIRLGQFTSYVVDNHKLQGTVFDIKDPADSEAASNKNTEGAAPEQTDSDKVTLKISLPTNLDFELKPGMKADVQFSIK